MGRLKFRLGFLRKKQFLMIFVLAFLIIINIDLFAKEKETFTIALTGKYPPFNFYSDEGKLVGFDVDTAKKISKHLNRKLVIIPTEWDSIVAGLLFKKYDAIIGSMAITPERAKKVNFSIPYYISGAQLFIHKRNREKIKKITDLYGKKVGVGLGETYEHYLRKNHPSIKIVTYKSTVDIFMDMHNNRLDGFLTDRLVGLYQIKKGHMPFIPAGQLLYEEKMAIPVTINNTELLTNINKALKRMKEDGTSAKLHKKWFGSASVSDPKAERDMRTEVIIKKLAQGFAITLFVAFISILFGFILSVPSGIILNSKKTFLYHILRSSNDIIRGTPLLIQLFFVYFGAPQIGITLAPIQAAIITLTINSSAYMSEVIRSGLMAVDHGQNLAGKALGLTKLQVFRYVIWPQSFRVSLPPLVNSVVALMKDTALIAMISVGEVIRETQSIISVTYNPIKYYFIVGAMFFVFTFPLMKMANKLEKNIKERGFTHA
ncbi:MAG: ABC transporter substrate-binding protein/permease [bacterium]|nr:ABC transporter substrate-binding protein/permease [bacterium]